MRKFGQSMFLKLRKTLPACVLSRFSRVQLFGTLWTVTCQAPLSMGFSRQEYWSWLLCPPPGDLPTQESNPGLLSLLHWQVGCLPLMPSGKPTKTVAAVKTQSFPELNFLMSITYSLFVMPKILKVFHHP